MVRKLFLFALIFLAALASSHAENASKPDSGTEIEKLLELSWVKKYCEAIPAYLNANPPKRKPDMTAQQHALLLKILKESYTSEAFYEPIKEEFTKNFDERSVSTLLEWLNSPLAKKMIPLEVQATTPQGQQELKKYAARLQGSKPSQVRMDLVKRLDNARGTSEWMTEMIFTMTHEVVALTAAAQRQKKEAELKQMRVKMYPLFHTMLQASTLASYLVVYAPVRDSELKAYVEFWESDTGKWFSRNFSHGILNAMFGVTEAMGKKVRALKATKLK